MPSKIQTIGQLLVKDALPPEMQDPSILNKKGLKSLMGEIANQHPDKYIDTLQELNDIGRQAATEYGGVASISLNDLKIPPQAKAFREKVKAEMDKITQNPKLTSKQKNEKVTQYMMGVSEDIRSNLLEEAYKNNNAMALQAKQGIKGNPLQFSQLLFGDLLLADHKGRPVPIVGLHGYAEGVTPAELWAGSYGSRAGYYSVQFGTAKGGFLGKQVAAVAQDVVVTEDDCGAVDKGVLRDGRDTDNIGSVLAAPVAGLQPGHIITKSDLSMLDNKKVLVRNLNTCQAESGVCQKCAGQRENGDFPDIGHYLGVEAGRIVSEPITQAALCLAEGTEVQMADGSSKEIQDIIPGDKVIGLSEDLKTTMPVDVIDIYDNGKKEVYEYTFKNSITREESIIKCTPDHKVLAEDGTIKPIKDVEGVLIPRTTFDDSSEEYINNKYALLIGLLLGDGCYTESVNSVNFSCADAELLKESADYMESLGLKFTKLKGHKYYYKTAMLDSTAAMEGTRDPETGQMLKGDRNPIKREIKRLGMWGKYSYEKEIPDEVLTWDNDSVGQLLAGLFITDGSIFLSSDKKYIKLQLTSCSKPLLDRCSHLLQSRFSIKSNVLLERKNWKETGIHKHAPYRLNIGSKDDVKLFLKNIKLLGKKYARAVELIYDLKYDLDDISDSLFKKKTSSSIGLINTFDIEINSNNHLFRLCHKLFCSNSEKHSGGSAGQTDKKIKGFEEINQFFQVPKYFVGGATLAAEDGEVKAIKPAPQGGSYLFLNDKQVYIPDDSEITVKIGDKVDAGDVLTDGTPNPAEVAQYKGIGEGRRYFADKLYDILEQNNAGSHRRNIDAISRGFIDKIKIKRDLQGYNIGDIVSYSNFQRSYTPRENSEKRILSQSKGRYLEAPVLHYSIGTKVNNSVLKTLKENGVKEILTHEEDAGFEPMVIRPMDYTTHDADWKARLAGWNIKKGFLNAVQHGSTSLHEGTSPVPKLMDPGLIK